MREYQSDELGARQQLDYEQENDGRETECEGKGAQVD
jgi:hypothetical protein